MCPTLFRFNDKIVEIEIYTFENDMQKLELRLHDRQ